MLRQKILFDTQVISNVNTGVITDADWNIVLKYLSENCRYAISVNTLYELLDGLANGDDAHFHTNQNRVRLLYQPTRREFLPLVGDFVRLKVFRLPTRRMDFRPYRLKLWVEVVLAAKTKLDLQKGKVLLRRTRRTSRSYGFDLKLLSKQIQDGKSTHSQRFEDLRRGILRPSTASSWSKAVLSLIDVPDGAENERKLLSALSAAYQYDASLYDMAKNHLYDFGRHDSDWIDSQQLYYLADPSIYLVTCDTNLKLRTRKCSQAERILNFEDLKKLATCRDPVSLSR